jgi:hypothetical protein
MLPKPLTGVIYSTKVCYTKHRSTFVRSFLNRYISELKNNFSLRLNIEIILKHCSLYAEEQEENGKTNLESVLVFLPLKTNSRKGSGAAWNAILLLSGHYCQWSAGTLRIFEANYCYFPGYGTSLSILPSSSLGENRGEPTVAVSVLHGQRDTDDSPGWCTSVYLGGFPHWTLSRTTG